jgi:WD40 repeat protein
MNPCPTRDELRLLLAEQLCDEERADVEAHVEGCPACQEMLAELAGGAPDTPTGLPSTCGRAVRFEPAPEFLRQLEQGLRDSGTGEVARTAVPAPESAPEESTCPAVDGYEVVGVLGRGGMGVVYHARHLKLGRPVALKMIRAGGEAGPQELARFRTEAEAVARLRHPNIVQIYEIGEHQAQPYLALEYVEGGSLRQKLDGTPLPPRQAAALVETAARAVEHAHQRGVAHRDLTPGNLLLTSEGTPKVTDFGLAKFLTDDGAGHTQTGMILGTPSYMAPEQVGGRSWETGPGTDVYALGAILYECLTGRPPFKAGSPMETLLQVQSMEAVPPSRLLPKVPRDLETVCLKCLEKEPRKRYPSAGELAEDLRRFLADEPIRARRASAAERAWRWCRRNRAVASLASAVALLLLLGAVGASVIAVRLKAQRDDLQKAERERTEELIRSHLEGARAGRLTGAEGQGFKGLALIQRALTLQGATNLTPEQVLEFRNEATACLATPDVRVVQQQDSGMHGEPGGYTFDAALERYTYFDPRERQFVVRRIADNAVLKRLPPPPEIDLSWFGAEFSRDGRFLTVAYPHPVGGHHQVVVWDLETDRRVLNLTGVRSGWYPRGGTTWTAVMNDRTVRVYQLPQGEQIRRFRYAGELPPNFQLDPRGQYVASFQQGNLDIRDFETGKVVAEFPHEARIEASAWSDDGRRLAAACDDRRIYIYDMKGWRLLSVLDGPYTAIRLAFSPAGNLLAAGTWSDTTIWDVAAGRRWLTLPGAFPYFSTDGRRLGLKRGSNFGVWHVSDGRVCRTLYPDSFGNRTSWWQGLAPRDVNFSTDGRLLASADGYGLRLWDATAGVEAGQLAIGQTGNVRFDPLGRGFVTVGQNGLHHWAIQPDETAAPTASGVALAHVGQTPRVALRASRVRMWTPLGSFESRASWDRDGRQLAVSEFYNRRALIFDANQPASQVVLQDGRRVISVALSSDGKWAATAAWKALGVKVWEAATGRLIKTLPTTRSEHAGYQVAFSPDGRWLIVGSDTDCQWWRVGSWEPDRTIGGQWPLAFAPDASLLALTTNQNTVRLVDPADPDREFATLTAPDRLRTTWLCFSPDGSQLAASSSAHTIQLWDLRLLRQQLAALGLDWGLPTYPPAEHADTTKPLRVTVDWGRVGAKTIGDEPSLLGFNSLILAMNPFNFEAYHQRGRAYGRLGEIRKAIDDYSLALALVPPGHEQRAELLFRRAGQYERLGNYPQVLADLQQALELAPDVVVLADVDLASMCNNAAWRCVTGPQRRKTTAHALVLARKAVDLAPGDCVYRNTLGVVYYRLGRYREAAATLEKNLEANDAHYAAFDLFLLAMSYHQLGDLAKARDRYHRAVQWQGQAQLSRVNVEDLNVLRAEAEALLGLSAKSSLLPK